MQCSGRAVLIGRAAVGPVAGGNWGAGGAIDIALAEHGQLHGDLDSVSGAVRHEAA